jgi:hypothetical protein
MLMTITGMVQTRTSANLMSLGRARLRADRRWGGHHRRELPARFGEAQHVPGACSPGTSALN